MLFLTFFETIKNYFEKPIDPLTPEQVDKLKKLTDNSFDDSLIFHADKNSLITGTTPKALYVMYEGYHIGTAYGSRFVKSNDTNCGLRNAEQNGIISILMNFYK